MHYLADHQQQPAAIIYQNILLNPSGSAVFGVILGNCVFDGHGKVCAKYFRHTLFALDGRILAKENGLVKHISLELPPVMDAAWELVRGISDHHCPMIDPLAEWSTISLAEHFSEAEVGAHAD